MKYASYAVGGLFILFCGASNGALVSQHLNNISISGSTYNVVLYQDESGYTAFNDVYGTDANPPLTFTTQDDATVAAQALYEYAVAEDIDLSPFNPSGISINSATIPFDVDTLGIYGGFTSMVANVSTGVIAGPERYFSRDSQTILTSFATFSLVPVPVPAAAWLFGSGLLGLVGLARRK